MGLVILGSVLLEWLNGHVDLTPGVVVKTHCLFESREFPEKSLIPAKALAVYNLLDPKGSLRVNVALRVYQL